MTTLSPAQRAFLENPFVATVTTVRAEGSLHSTVVWVDTREGDVLFNTDLGGAKARQLAADPRLSLLVVDPADMYRWLAVEGPAELSEDGADEQLDRLSGKYLGQDVYPWRRPGQRRVNVRIHADRIESVGIEG